MEDLSNQPFILIPLISAPVFILAGWFLVIFPPKKINRLYGFRTARSMKDQAHWDFAQREGGKQMIIWGSLYLLTAAPGCFIETTSSGPSSLGIKIGIACTLLILFSIIPLWMTEQKIKQHFNS